MKQCRICKKEKTLDDFYKISKARSYMGDGHDTRCKECAKALAKTEEQKVKNRLRDKLRQNNPKRLESQRRYQSSEKGKSAHKRAFKKYRQTEHGHKKLWIT